MRTLHLLASANRRGAEVFGAQLAERLESLGHSSEVVALSPAADPSAALPVEVVPALGALGALRSLRRRAASADVVLGHGSRGLVAGTLATVGNRTPLVYRSIGDPTYWGASWARRTRVGLQLRRAAAVTALWPEAGDAICAQYGVDHSRIVIVPNGVDEQAFTPATAATRAAGRAALGLPADVDVILAVGALSPEKRIDRAIEATARTDAHLVIAGDGPEREAITHLAERLLPGRHHLLGSVRDVTPLYAAANVLVLLSASEGQPGVAIEAAMSALPVVATDVGGVSSVVVHDATGLLVPADASADRIADALTDAISRANELGTAGAARCHERFAMTTVAAQFDQVLRDAVGGLR